MTETGRPLVYVVEDEADIGDLIRTTLAGYGYEAEHVRTGAELTRRLRARVPALCIVDLGLPDVDGLQLVRDLQERAGCAILILTGRQHVADRILGLELGADDYMVKPFEPRELVARVRSILRRLGRAADAVEAPAPSVARFEGWTFEPARNRLLDPAGQEVALSTAETRLLEAFVRSPNRILSRDQLLQERDLEPLDRSIDVRISRLRRKLGEDPSSPRLIKTIYGAGYMFSVDVGWC
ncbi:response regulator transcription factor [Azospirillum sp.]|uniref:response regulator transcription factor n=1 Tax=Azospirillum sp. TaxID=34012 RepID=UPI002D61865D|nr:response regulator transcription factor [Azospirillum sp.]HYD68868.1 response regulator transcription factor [Azospirillum sp.]